MSGRAAARAEFLRAAGWGAARIAPLAGDASDRRYLRLNGGPGGRGAVLMDAPPEPGRDCRPFVAMTAHLRGLGLSAPAILADDLDRGFLLLEDLGDALFARVCAGDPTQEPTLYAAAVDLIAALAAEPPPATFAAAGRAWPAPVYDMAVLTAEARVFTDWWWPAAAGQPPSAGQTAEYEALIRDALAPVAAAREALVLRDYHAENLVWLPGRAGPARVGLLDYQDALVGSAAYDLVSLLEDARRDTSPELRDGMIERYLRARGIAAARDRAAFRAACAVLGAQRNLKIIGIFARLRLRDRKPAYLDLIPRVWAHLRCDLSHPALAALGDWIGRWAPAPTGETVARLRAAA